MPKTKKSGGTLKTTKKKSWATTIREMIGRTEDVTVLDNDWNITNLFANPTLDTSKPVYALNMSIFKCSITTDKEGKKFGQEYILGATFGKPIVNSCAAFAFSGLNPPQLIGEGDYIDKMNNFLYKERKSLFLMMRDGMRDGDAYLRLMINEDNEPYLELVSPEMVDIIIDPENVNNVLGYNITHIIPKDEYNMEKEIIIEEYRKKSPYYKRVKMVSNRKEIQEETDDIPFLAMAHFANEKDANALNGTSDYQNIYVLMKSYHGVMENAIKGTIYNSQPTPIIKGIKNFTSFLRNNFKENGSSEAGAAKYDVQYNANKMMLLGEGMDMEMLTIPDHITPATKMLEYIFYCIVQASETPEFVMGTAVQSSKASVSEQLPVVVNKAARKRVQFEDALYEIIDIYTKYLLATNGVKESDVKDTEINIEWPSIETEDKQLNLDIVKTLLAEGIITAETALGLTEVKVQDIGVEVAEARKQSIQKAIDEAQNSDIYSPYSASQQANEDVKEMTDKDDYKSDKKVK